MTKYSKDIREVIRPIIHSAIYGMAHSPFALFVQIIPHGVVLLH